MARPIRNVLTKVTEFSFQNVSPPWFSKEQQINQTEREQGSQLSFD